MLKINPKDTKAILIGVSEFQDKANFVNAAPIKNNVPKLKELLLNPKILGLPEENILVFNQNERHDEILKGIKTFLDKDFADTVIFYFAGHGYKTDNGDFYMVTNNSEADWISSSAIPWKVVKNMLQKGNGIQQRFYILDACHSGAATLSADDNLLEIEKGSALIAAASEDEKAYFNKKEQYTDFTKALIQTIENGSENIELEAFDVNYIHNNIEKILKKTNNRFDTQIKKTDKIDNVAFFKNKKYDKQEILRRKQQAKLQQEKNELLEQIKKADKLYEEFNFIAAEALYSRAKRNINAQNIDIDKKILNELDQKIKDSENIQKYERIFDNRYKNKYKEESINKLKQIEQLEKENALNKERAVKFENLIATSKKNLQELKKQETDYQKKIKDLENKINTTAENSDITSSEYAKIISQKKELEIKQAETEKRIKQADKQIIELNAKVTELTKQLSQKETQINKVSKELNDLKPKYKKIQSDYNALNTDIDKQIAKKVKKIYTLIIPIFVGLLILAFWQPWKTDNKIAGNSENVQDTTTVVKKTNYPKPDNDIVWQDATHGTFTDTRDGKKYKVVKIGTQIWMAENFNYTKNIPHITDKNVWEKLGDNKTNAAWCYYDNKAENGNKYGALYIWAAALKVAPKGWHLPSKKEWETLLNNYGGEGEKAYKALIKGGNSDLNVLFGGWRSINGDFYGLGHYTGFWSATEGSSASAWSCYLTTSNENAKLGNYYKSVGLSVRLLRD